MKLVMYQDCISPHQMPLACELARYFGEADFRYVFRDVSQAERACLGWSMGAQQGWCVHMGANSEVARELIENADVLLTMFRDVEMLQRRASRGLRTFVQTERWFKPFVGFLRLLSPRYWGMARAFVRLMNVDGVVYFPMGMHAARDMARLCGLFAGDLRCLFRPPELRFERVPGGKIWPKNGHTSTRYCLDKMRMWGYFVEPSRSNKFTIQDVARVQCEIVKVLWVGRLLNWKRVDTIVRAVCAHANLKRMDNSLPEITLDIYGTGPEEERLQQMAHGYEEEIKFHPAVPIDRVRQLMREHDVYVLSSNAYEGWGAVVSEALEEGMKVIGTYEAGSSVTMLPESNLFHAGDWKALKRMLEREIATVGVDGWSARNAAKCIWEQIKDE